MLKSDDEVWLSGAHPGLRYCDGRVEGLVSFSASYDAERNRFQIFAGDANNCPQGIPLNGEFHVRIEERSDKSISSLPALYVNGIEPVSDRHFSQLDKTACLCSPFEEAQFLEPEFRFIPFFEELVIPFLYGQTFFSKYEHWPWDEYAHGSTGLLEAYSKSPEGTRPDQCLQLLRRDAAWPKIKVALQQHPFVKGHTPCFCPKGDQMRRCHPRALRGVLRLQRDLRSLNIPVSQMNSNF